MKPYLSILKARFGILFQYRAAALAGLGTQLFWGAIKVMIMQAFFAQSFVHQPMSLSQTITFIWLGQALLQLLPWNLDKEIAEQIRNGDVAYQLVRPLDLYWSWYYRALAMRIVPTFLRAIPLFIVSSLFFDLAAPVSITSIFGFGFSIVLATLLSASITALVIISLFWTISGEGIVRLMPHTVVLLSGMVIPLPLFPEWMQPFLSLQPFRGIIDIPARIYTGLIPSNEIPLYLAFQLIWMFIMIFIGKALISRAIKQFVVQGG